MTTNGIKRCSGESSSRDPLHQAFRLEEVWACVMTSPWGWDVRVRSAPAQESPHTAHHTRKKRKHRHSCTQCTRQHKHHGDPPSHTHTPSLSPSPSPPPLLTPPPRCFLFFVANRANVSGVDLHKRFNICFWSVCFLRFFFLRTMWSTL